MTLERRLMAEWLGTFSLLATVIGSGIMAERLTSDTGLALLANTSQLPCFTGVSAGTTKCEACIDGCGNTTHCERSHYVLPDGLSDIILARQPTAREGGGPREHAFFFSTRLKGGAWSPSRVTNLPDIGSNLNTVSAILCFPRTSP